MNAIERKRQRLGMICSMLDDALKIADEIGDDLLAVHIEHARACAAERFAALK